MNYWAVAQTAPNAERITELRLRTGRLPGARRFDAFVPMARERRRCMRGPDRGKFVIMPVVMFPGYLILKIEDFWYPALECEGVVRIILDGDAPAKLPESEVVRMREDQRRRGYTEFAFGQRVRVDDRKHPMFGLEATYQRFSNREKVRALFNILGQDVPVDIDERVLVAA